jgi:glucans biosynthesis protein
LESHFEKRPSLWVEPIGDWGEGAVTLIEIPSKEEIHDNIVAFWRPHDPLRAKSEYSFNYRLYWGAGKPTSVPLAQFVKTRTGAGPDGTRRFILEAFGGPLHANDPNAFQARITADKGKIRNLVAQPNPVTGGWRISFELVTENQPVIEMRGQLMRQDKPVSEVWIYRWAP